jgi:hypothetical protein
MAMETDPRVADNRERRRYVALADLAFPADTVAAWLHAAYRHYLGLKATGSAIPRPDWTWPE